MLIFDGRALVGDDGSEREGWSLIGGGRVDVGPRVLNHVSKGCEGLGGERNCLDYGASV
jgi:hypothetical protein